MRHDEFQIGDTFWCGGHKWRCTDIGTRVIIAMRLDHIEVVIALEGDLDAKQRARLMEIADKCPVHRTLTSEVRIHTVEWPAG